MQERAATQNMGSLLAHSWLLCANSLHLLNRVVSSSHRLLARACAEPGPRFTQITKKRCLMNCKLLQGLTFGLVAAFALSAAVVAQTKIAPGQLSVRAWAGKPRLTWTQIQALKNAKTGHIPLWTYGLVAARDGTQYQGVMVGDDPTNPNSGQQDVPTPVVPAVYIFNVIATGINEDGSFQTKPGITVFDPTVADDACMAAPN